MDGTACPETDGAPHVRTFYFWRLLLERFRERMGASSGERLGRKRIMCVVLPTGVTM